MTTSSHLPPAAAASDPEPTGWGDVDDFPFDQGAQALAEPQYYLMFILGLDPNDPRTTRWYYQYYLPWLAFLRDSL